MNSLILLILTTCLSSHASTEEVLTHVDQYLGQPSFAESFRDQDEFEIVFDESAAGLPSSRMNDFCHVKVLPQSPNLALIEHWSGGQYDPKTERISRDQWNEAHGNALRLLVGTIESYGFRVSLEEKGEVQVAIELNGQSTSVSAQEIGILGVNGAGQQTSGGVLISRDLPGRAQIVRRTEVGTKPWRFERTWTIPWLIRKTN